jgi:long-subunit acyl-CoA synthetase (AMP-forming)
MLRSTITLGRKISSSGIRMRTLLSTAALRPLENFPYETLVELQQKATVAYTTNPMLGTVVNGAYEWMTYSQFDVEVAKCRAMLKANNVGFDDKVALISNNRAEWAVIKYASVGLGAQIVPM